MRNLVYLGLLSLAVVFVLAVFSTKGRASTCDPPLELDCAIDISDTDVVVMVDFEIADDTVVPPTFVSGCGSGTGIFIDCKLTGVGIAGGSGDDTCGEDSFGFGPFPDSDTGDGTSCAQVSGDPDVIACDGTLDFSTLTVDDGCTLVDGNDSNADSVRLSCHLRHAPPGTGNSNGRGSTAKGGPHDRGTVLCSVSD